MDSCPVADTPKACLLCDEGTKDAFSQKQWTKSTVLARICKKCVDVSVSHPSLNEAFGFVELAAKGGWEDGGVSEKRGFMTLGGGAGLKWVKEVEGHVQNLTFWPSTGTVESSVNHPGSAQRKQFYRHSSKGSVRYFLEKLFGQVS